MSICGTYIGPSWTGAVHVIECGKLLYGKFVTAKMVKRNYLNNWNHPYAKGGKNILVLREIVITGIVV
jgi:hypothetical protein